MVIISQNYQESEVFGGSMPDIEAKNILKLSNFTTKNGNVKSPIHETISLVVRLVNKHKLDYNQILYILKQVRVKCDISYPKKTKKLPKLPTKSELLSFYRIINNPIHKLIFEVLEGSGIRVSELVSLKVSEIDFDSNTLFINQGKGGKDRVAVIGNRLKEKLVLYLEGRNNIYLFESNRNTKFTSRRIQQLCTHYAEMANVANVLHCHAFRHLFITNLASNNISREKREIIVGHSKNSKAHDIYTHLSIGNISKSEIINILDKEN